MLVFHLFIFFGGPVDDSSDTDDETVERRCNSGCALSRFSFLNIC